MMVKETILQVHMCVTGEGKTQNSTRVNATGGDTSRHLDVVGDRFGECFDLPPTILNECARPWRHMGSPNHRSSPISSL